MGVNNRVFYACKRAGIAYVGAVTHTTLHGVQSVGFNTSFNLEQFFEYGQLDLYDNVEGIPDVEITINRILDGYCPAYLVATQLGTSATLLGRSKPQCSLILGIYSDDEESAITGANAPLYVISSGLCVSSVSFAGDVNGAATEDLTLIGPNKLWRASGDTDIVFADSFVADVPYAITGSGGVQMREDFLLGDGADGGFHSRFPTDIYGTSTPSGFVIADVNGNFPVHIQRVSARADLGREPMLEMGRKGYYHRFVNFPVEVTTEIAVISVSGDNVSCLEEGIIADPPCGGRNLTDQNIQLCWCDGLHIDLGSKNKLQSVTMGGGDTGGGNDELVYTYTNWNNFTVYHPQDPRWGTEGFTSPLAE